MGYEGEQWKVVSLVALRKSEKPEEVGEIRAKRERERGGERERERETKINPVPRNLLAQFLAKVVVIISNAAAH